MDLSKLLMEDHRTIRERLQRLKDVVAKASDASPLSQPLQDLQEGVKRHFDREETFYRRLDQGKRVDDRSLMHGLRNDHAGTIFTLESLVIKLRKAGPNTEWKKRFQQLLDVLEPHLDREESVLFPQVGRWLTPADLDDIAKEMDTTPL
jgi:hemerythrin-like domain-containing protein